MELPDCAGGATEPGTRLGDQAEKWGRVRRERFAQEAAHSSECMVCERAAHWGRASSATPGVVSMTAGICQACYEPWRYASKPERGEWVPERRQRMKDRGLFQPPPRTPDGVSEWTRDTPVRPPGSAILRSCRHFRLGQCQSSWRGRPQPRLTNNCAMPQWFGEFWMPKMTPSSVVPPMKRPRKEAPTPGHGRGERWDSTGGVMVISRPGHYADTFL